MATHFSSPDAGDGSNCVMYIRYEDSYQRVSDGGWLITERVVTSDAIERHPVISVADS